MSEEILKALAQLYAIITKQDGGPSEREREYVITAFRRRLDQESVKGYLAQYDEQAGYGKETSEEDKAKLTSVKDSVKTLAICKKINKTLTQKQKVVVLIELLELVRSDGNLSPQRKGIIDTVAEVFNIAQEEFASIQAFVLEDNPQQLQYANLLLVNNHNPIPEAPYKFLASELVDECVFFIRLESVDMLFVKYLYGDNSTMNSQYFRPTDVELYPSGSIIKTRNGATFFYSEISSIFLRGIESVELSFNVEQLEFTFPNGAIGLHGIALSEGPGKLIGIMGASGAGKTTLLNALSGLETPSKGSVKINGIDVHRERKKTEGLIGYIAQDDLLIEELTVFENLYFNAKLCFADKSKAEIAELVAATLNNLGLLHIKDLKVGSPLNKSISGGQRKRLNIALELIREPQVLFVDEPTSGLSSRDSENVIDLLKELSYKGKLIFVVIHQPSSDIYKMFDKFVLLDTGGYQIFYGNPIEAITYFKRISNQADADKGQCNTCGSVNPEQLFNTIEEQVVDEYGNYTGKRKISPTEWNQHFKEQFSLKRVEEVLQNIQSSFRKPSVFKQFQIFTQRDLRSKWSNTQYMLINLLEAPFLAFLLSVIIRYNNTPDGTGYLYRYNDNIPAYILMSIVVALFMGLSVSAEEIIRDRKIMKREKFLNLSRSSYLYSKILILFGFSALQTLSFVFIGNSILEIQGQFWMYWMMLFSVACSANLIGLNASAVFKTAVAVYIVIPLLLIPQMILSGAMFDFEKINDWIKRPDKVPVLADAMISRWAYEGIAVQSYIHNPYASGLYVYEQKERRLSFEQVYAIPLLKEKFAFIEANLSTQNDTIKYRINLDLALLKNEWVRYAAISPGMKAGLSMPWELARIDKKSIQQRIELLDELDGFLEGLNKEAQQKREALLLKAGEAKVNRFKDLYFNESLSDLVRNKNGKEKIAVYKDHLVHKTEAVYFPPSAEHVLDYRAHFYAPKKLFLGVKFNTYIFNISVIWFFSMLLYIVLYFDGITRFGCFLKRLKFKKS